MKNQNKMTDLTRLLDEVEEALDSSIDRLETVSRCNSPITGADLKTGNDVQIKYLEQALSNIKALREATSWQPIETAPRDGTEIILTNGFEVYTGLYRKSNITNYAPYFCKSCDGEVLNDGYDWEESPIYMHEPTHWMPLPQPPEGDE